MTRKQKRLAVIAGGGYWYLKRPAPQPTLQPLTAADGTVMTRVIPGTQPKAQVLVAVNDDQKLTDNQLSTLSRSASALTRGTISDTSPP